MGNNNQTLFCCTGKHYCESDIDQLIKQGLVQPKITKIIEDSQLELNHISERQKFNLNYNELKLTLLRDDTSTDETIDGDRYD